MVAIKAFVLFFVIAIGFILGLEFNKFIKKPEGVVTAKDAQAGVNCYIARTGDAVGISCLSVAESKTEVKKTQEVKGKQK